MVAAEPYTPRISEATEPRPKLEGSGGKPDPLEGVVAERGGIAAVPLGGIAAEPRALLGGNREEVVVLDEGAVEVPLEEV